MLRSIFRRRRPAARQSFQSITRRRPFGWVAADCRLQFGKVDEYVGLAPQFVGKHRRVARNRRYHGDANATALHRLHQRAEIAVAGEQYDPIDVFRRIP